jgi:hypothetical protein
MSFTWPEFKKVALGDGRSWSATFDSYDQYHEDCYYVVTLEGEVGTPTSFMVQVGTEFAGDDWNTPEVLRELTDRIARVAATGQTNTTYTGPVLRG